MNTNKLMKFGFREIRLILDNADLSLSWSEFEQEDGCVDLYFFKEYFKLVRKDIQRRIANLLDTNVETIVVNPVLGFDGTCLEFELILKPSEADKALAAISKMNELHETSLFVSMHLLHRLFKRFVETNGAGCSDCEIDDLKMRTYRLVCGQSSGMPRDVSLISLLEEDISDGCIAWFDEDNYNFVVAKLRKPEDISNLEILNMIKQNISKVAQACDYWKQKI